MNKITRSFLFLVLLALIGNTQVLQGINYQTVIHDGDGNILTDHEISLQAKIRTEPPDGETVCQETHSAITNTNGLVNLVNGYGTSQTEPFTDINLGAGNKYLESAIDLEGSGNYSVLGVTQFLDVPFAKVADVMDSIPSMSTEERNAIANPSVGMAIYNTTSNCLNYFNGINWFEICGDCTPMPLQADAGPDQIYTDITTTLTLNANTPDVGNGLWTIVSGKGGILDDATNPASLFSGITDETYMLEWAISTSCDTSADTVTISMNSLICGDTMIDPRNGNIYNIVQIGEQCWFKENLNYESGDSWCYDNHSANCAVYGRLYNWQTAITACPTGWHLPSDDEWKILEGTVDSQYALGDSIWDDYGWRGFDAGLDLKSTSGWYGNGNGTDHHGFSALPGGYRYPSGSFYYLAHFGYWWSSSESSDTHAWSRHLYYDNDGLTRGSGTKAYGVSVRCIKDNGL